MTSADLRGYLSRVEPVRLGVNQLLGRADPILDAYRSGEATPTAARRAFDQLVRSFDSYRTQIAAVQPTAPELSRIHAPYANTYKLEATYLHALADALPTRAYHHLPHTAAKQRRAIVRWRTNLTVVAQGLRVRLPADLSIAGVGEIAPSPSGN